MWDMSQLGSMMTGFLFILAISRDVFQQTIGTQIEELYRKLFAYLNPYLYIKFQEYQGEDLMRSKAYKSIEHYLTNNSTTLAKRLKANVDKDCRSIVMSMDEYEEIIDVFNGVKVWWSSRKIVPQNKTLVFGGSEEDERRYYQLTCYRKDRDFITKIYLHHVLYQGDEIAKKERQRKIYTNANSKWTYIPFEHPSTFRTLAMDPKKKKEILNDLTTFRNAKDYYKEVGKCWKRGYLLYGPPGTGKSSMIAAMANLLEYDIYDLELTAVKSNTELKKLLITTSCKSIIVIEDIDCSLDLTGQRKNVEEKKDDVDDEKDEKDLILKEKSNEKDKKNEVSLSGLLNFIDGLWSACGSERIIVFTTNHVEKLDPALIRRGRMDMHIEMSYCCFEAFKVLAKNYLKIESHKLFAKIGRLLEEINMTPADVAETLMPKSPDENAYVCLKKLIACLEKRKEESRLKPVEDANLVKVKDEEGKSQQVSSESDDESNGEEYYWSNEESDGEEYYSSGEESD